MGLSKFLAIARPLSFEPNRGQTARQVQYLTHSRDLALFLTSDDIVLRLANPGARRRSSVKRGPADGTVLHLRPVGGNSRIAMRGAERMRGRVNYFIGGDSSKWHTDIPTFAKVVAPEVWKGVDLAW